MCWPVIHIKDTKPDKKKDGWGNDIEKRDDDKYTWHPIV